jgi:hypothetical protein
MSSETRSKMFIEFDDLFGLIKPACNLCNTCIYLYYHLGPLISDVLWCTLFRGVYCHIGILAFYPILPVLQITDKAAIHCVYINLSYLYFAFLSAFCLSYIIIIDKAAIQRAYVNSDMGHSLYGNTI